MDAMSLSSAAEFRGEGDRSVAANRNDSSGSAVWADENVGGDAQLLAQPDDHGDGQGPLVVEHFGDARSASDDARKVASGQPHLLHPEPDGIDRVWRIDGVVLRLARYVAFHAYPTDTLR